MSGKHNDLEEVGHDTYHHTMFEMLGNWSFGDYFKEGAIDMAWEYLVDVLKLRPEDLYVTVFEGDATEGLERDDEAAGYWLKHVPADHIINGNKHDNFWEMGDTGPCGPCSEIHLDSRTPEEKAKVAGRDLVNKDDPQVIEIWNLVFMQFNRKADGSLEKLSMNVIDTGMGFERLVRAIQGKHSNYDTDVFQPMIHEIERQSGKTYGKAEDTDVAMRVIADHIRAVSFSIADGQLPGNAKAGYVIRRILRRAVRYAYTFLDQKDAFMFKLVPMLVHEMGEAYPELKAQQELITRVIKEEEDAFLRTLDRGIRLLDEDMAALKANGKTMLDGTQAFRLFDTYGFPLDLTELICRERYRQVKQKKSTYYELVLDATPFYGEMGGQVGDQGVLVSETETVEIIDTKRENNQSIHIVKKLPEHPEAPFMACVDTDKREASAANHSATHLLHHALKQVLGEHVEQKGSFVSPDTLRFDFSHFQKVTDEEIRKVERLVNDAIRRDLPLQEFRDTPIEEARKLGAVALFGEKYGDKVRVVKFGDSVEFCGGIHAHSTGHIGMFKIVAESSVAAGIRRIEAKTGSECEELLYNLEDGLKAIKALFNNSKDLQAAIEKYIGEHDQLKKQVEQFQAEAVERTKEKLLSQGREVNGVKVFTAVIPAKPEVAKDLVFKIRAAEPSHSLCVVGSVFDNKPMLNVCISEDLVNEHGLNAGQLVREAAKLIQGGGGGQPHFASAGGKNADALSAAVDKVIELAKL